MMNLKQLFIFPLLLLGMVAMAQTAEKKWDSTFRPNNYQFKVKLFESYPNSKKDIIFLGNSITANANWNELLDLKRAINRGISGDITFGVLERLNEVIEGKPAKVFLLIGINDISRNIPDSVIISNYQKIVKKIKQGSPKTKIYVHTLMPVNNEFTQFKNHYNKDAHILALNTAIRNLAQQEKVQLIDLYPHFLNSLQKLEKKYTEDGLHLNAEGYKVWASLLKNGHYL